MNEMIFKPDLYRYDTCREFADEMQLGRGDLVITNEYIYAPFFYGLDLGVRTIFQEKYGGGEPSDIMVQEIIREACREPFSRIIAIGGGTVMDIAKVLSVADGPDVNKLYDMMPDLSKRAQLILVPTTCGTGAEMTNIAVMYRTSLDTKMGLVSPAMYADTAVLVPELCSHLPFSVFATSSIDALVHAVESALSPNSTPYTRLFSYKAVEIIIKNYQDIARYGRDILPDVIDEFLTASNFAGIAFGTAGCGPVHAASYPLGGKYHIAHGESNYAVFTGVLKKYLSISSGGELDIMNHFIADLMGCPVDEVYDRLEDLLNKILQKKPLHEYGVTKEDLPEFAQSVIDEQTRLMKNSFVPLGYSDILDIYMSQY